MAILVMSVGVLAVMSLFPIAFLRSAQGTQLTNATLLKMRAESLVDMFGLVTDVYIPQPIEGDVTRCLIDPLAWKDVAASLDPANGPFANANEYGVDENLQRLRYRPSNSPVALVNIPVQPTRFINLAGLGIARDVWPMPLRRLGFATGPRRSEFRPIRPYPFDELKSALFESRQSALNAVALPDTMETHLTATPETNTDVQVTFQADTVAADDLAALEGMRTSATPAALRLVLVGANGKQSQVRLPAGINAATRTITWAVPLPATANFQTLSEVRVESPDPRYTWMLTVRKKGISGGSVTEIDCVVFFNRAAEDPEEELVHAAAIPSGAPEIPPEDAAYAGTVSFRPYPSDPQRVPPLKNGGYVFDPTHAQWYRVQDILFEDTERAVIRLDRRPRQYISTLVVPRGVVQVFPMKPRVDEGRRL